MWHGFPTGTSRYSHKKCVRTGNTYFQGVFISFLVWGGTRLSSIPMVSTTRENWNDIKVSPSTNIQPNDLSLGVLCWPFPLRRYSTHTFRYEHYYPQKGLSMSLMGLQMKGWMECGSGNVSLPMPISGFQGYQDRDGIISCLLWKRNSPSTMDCWIPTILCQGSK